MPLTHINLFSFVCVSEGAIAGDSLFLFFIPIARPRWPFLSSLESLPSFRSTFGRLIRIINHWGAFANRTIEGESDVKAKAKTRKCLKMQQCNQGIIPATQFHPSKLMSRHLFACLLISHHHISLMLPCWWNINKFTWISISIFKSSPSLAPPHRNGTDELDAESRKEANGKKQQHNVIVWRVHKKSEEKCSPTRPQMYTNRSGGGGSESEWLMRG